MYNSVPDKKEHFFINSYKNIYKFFKLDKLIWDGVVYLYDFKKKFFFESTFGTEKYWSISYQFVLYFLVTYLFT